MFVSSFAVNSMHATSPSRRWVHRSASATAPRRSCARRRLLAPPLHLRGTAVSSAGDRATTSSPVSAAPFAATEGAPATLQTPLVPILMGSKADRDHCERIARACRTLGLHPELRVASAHKVPSRLMDVISAYEADPRPKVYLSVAGRSNALSGMLDCAVSSPVIACPPPSESFGGADIFSSLRMPGGVSPMVVLDPANAALAAAKIFAVYDERVRQRVAALQKSNRDRLYVDDAELNTKEYESRIQHALATQQVLLQSPDGNASDASNAGWRRKQGKVRDQFTRSDRDHIILVTTDRQSAFDRVLAAVPFKGAVLNLTSAWWFEHTASIVPNHVIAVPHPNVTIARRCTPFPIEFVVRGYATGSTSTSLWKNYERGERVYCGIRLPDGLRKNQRLWTNLVTPTTKDDAGDALVSREDILQRRLMTADDFDACAAYALRLFEYGQRVAAEHGLILVDTKYEFGRDADGTIRLIDEIHTPDSSRYWLATSYEERMASGKEPENVDKEILRLWFRDHCDPYQDKQLPEAPAELVVELSRRYIQLYEMITWQRFVFDAQPPSAITTALERWL
ncbi:hypothetical protein CDCA_CDCA14G3779 [Cyanidium caldarium]|uniref:SAICAR synthetase n=1 Tax=Cyanidium caldarium TaxID=2771 RepID=A0AAV9J0A1_CYACA|nr:hypothetical protein CDCA_CDCA14G3779 [Cyanidium caldarium]